MRAKPSRSFERAVSALESALRFGIQPSLDGIRILTEVLDKPQRGFASIQVGGTNGKSSVTRMTAALLGAHNVHTGCYTSPHLECYTERVELSGSPIDPEAFARAVAMALEAAIAARQEGYAQEFTEFELLTAAALWAFHEDRVRVAVLEVGLGGTWDATSIVDPDVAVITGVGLDHMDYLGPTLRDIAADKGSIIRPGGTVVLGPGTAGVEDVFMTRASEVSADVIAVREREEATPVSESSTVRYEVVERPSRPGGTLVISVRGRFADYPGVAMLAPSYQAGNIAISIAAAEAFLGAPLDDDATWGVLPRLRIAGRFEVVRYKPLIVADVAHNVQSAEVLAGAIREAWPEHSARPGILLSVFGDKDAAGIIEALSKVTSHFAVTQTEAKRSLPAEELAQIVRLVCGTEPAVYPNVPHALEAELHALRAGLVVTGGHAILGEALGLTRPTRH